MNLPAQTMPAVVTTNNDYGASPQHDTMTDSAPWNTNTTDNNFDSTATFNDQGPPTNVQNVVVGSDTLDTSTYADARYDPSQPQPDVVAVPPPIDTQVPIMANDVHVLPPPTADAQQQTQQPQ